MAAVSSLFGPERSELEKKLDLALSKDNWGVPSNVLTEISNATHSSCVFRS